VNFKCKTAKHAAAGKGHLEVAQLLLAAGADMNAVPTHRPASPLDAAVAQGRSEMVQLAAGARADATHDDRCPPMLVAAQAGTSRSCSCC
jgi:protein DGCR14